MGNLMFICDNLVPDHKNYDNMPPGEHVFCELFLLSWEITSKMFNS